MSICFGKNIFDKLKPQGFIYFIHKNQSALRKLRGQGLAEFNGTKVCI